MILDVEALLRRGEIPARFALAKDGNPGEYEDPTVEVVKTQIEGTVEPVGFGVYQIAGQLTFWYQTQCARCLAPVSACETVDFFEEFARSESEEYPDRYLYEGQTLNLTQMVEDCIALNMPLRTLCSEDCKGLCPVCGADRNKESCSCSTGEDPQLNPFAVLAAKLREENEEV